MPTYAQTKQLRALKQKVKDLKEAREDLDDKQKRDTTNLKRLTTQYNKLKKIAGDRDTPTHESESARIKRDTQVGPKMANAKAQLEKLPQLINEMDLKVIKAQDELRELEEEIKNTPIPPSKPNETATTTSRPDRTTTSKARSDATASTRRQGLVPARVARADTQNVGRASPSNSSQHRINSAKAQQTSADQNVVPHPSAVQPEKPRKKRTKVERKETSWKGTARPGGVPATQHKRKASVLEDDDQPSKRTKTVETDDNRVLREKSTNLDVTAARGRTNDNAKSKKRARSTEPLTPMRPVKAPRNKYIVADPEDEVDDNGKAAPKCATPAGTAAGKGYTVPEAKMGTAPSTTPKGKGTKRTASWSVGDASAPEAKRLKTGPKDGSSSTARDESAEKESSGGDSTEMSAGSESDKTAASDTPASNATPETADDASSSSKKGAKCRFKGIKNFKNACFSASVIQLIDAALEGHDVDLLLGNIVETMQFGITDEECKKLEASVKGLAPKLLKKIDQVRNAIMVVSRWKNKDHVSVARHLRKLLEDLRKDNDDDDISAFRFQSVVAEGDQGDRPRKCMNGDDQWDASEYFTTVMSVLDKDPKTLSRYRLYSLFRIDAETTSRCRNPDCDHQSAPHKSNSNHHIVRVQEPADFSEVFESSKHSTTDTDCPNCRKTKLITSAKFTRAPDNFVVSMSRSGYDRKKQEATKNNAKIQLDQHELKIADKKYDLSAVIMHKGSSANVGHYIIFRKHGEDWYKIDDSKVEKVSREAVTDGKHGRSAMLLFKKQQS